MKKQQLQELKNKSVAELQKDLNPLYEKLANLRSELVEGKVKNIKEVKQVRKSIAQILTLINQREKIKI